MSPHDEKGMGRPEESNGSASSTLERMTSLEADSPDANSDMCNRAVQRHKAQLKTDPQLAAAAPDDEAKRQLTECYDRGGSCNELVATVCRVYGERNVFGHSVGGAAKFGYITYAQLWERIETLATGFAAENVLKASGFFGICGFASVDWVNCEFSCQYLGGVNVALPTNITAEDVAKVINEAELVGMACSVDELAALAPVLGACRTLRTFVVMDHEGNPNPQLPALVKQMEEGLPEGCRLLMLGDVMKAGKAAPKAPMAVPGKGEDPMISLFYTSGSTGLPKGAIYTTSVWKRYWNRAKGGMNTMPVVASIMLGFLPLNHLMGRMGILQCMAAGGSTAFVRKSDMSTYFEDLAAVRPTQMNIIPRLANMMYDKMITQLEETPDGDEHIKAAYKQEVMRKFREEDVGGRLVSAFTGSSPTAPEVITFLRDALLVPIYEGYGSTEAGMISMDWEMVDNVLEWKLADVPELGYLTTDRPFPRGELVLKTGSMINGYYKHPKASSELFDEDGFYMTGDVVQQESATRVVWIDRKKNVLKLAQGEFVSLGRLEAVYKGGSNLIHQIFLYGNSLRSYILAVVVPSQEAQALGGDAEVKKRIRVELDDVARKRALQGYEIPRDFIIEREPFSKANHLLTDSGKPATGRLRASFKDKLEAIYTQHEERQKERVRAIKSQAGQSSMAERVTQAVELTLGLSEADLAHSEEASFAQLGGDSLAAIQFARAIDDLCGVPLPVSFVLDHSNTLAAITAKVEGMLRGEGEEGITFEAIHGQDTSVIKAADLDLDRFLPPRAETPRSRPAPASELPAEPAAVLLTGANGFLGRFLLLDLLQRVSKQPGGYVAAVVRGSGDDAARSRLRSGFDTGDVDLLATFDRLSEGHLKVFAGDLAKTNLGLKPEVYKRLAAEVDTIVHNGALVNHAFSYRQLFEPNVLGTVEIMKLAVATRIKALTFVSSVGVAGGLKHAGPVSEEEVGIDLATELPGDGGYALGYGCSKWASEVQLQQLHERYGVPVSIFRCGMILAHSRYLGQINPTDFFTRLLAGITYTRLAPASFYKDPSGPDRHFDGMPIDFVAAGITGLLSHHRSGFDAYHVVNPHWDDGVSLDAIVKWLSEERGGVRHIQDYAQWYKEFKAALESLDPKRQSHSPLPIIYQWQEPIAGAGTKFDASKMRADVRKFTEYSDVPHLDKAFIVQNLRHMEALHIID